MKPRTEKAIAIGSALLIFGVLAFALSSCIAPDPVPGVEPPVVVEPGDPAAPLAEPTDDTTGIISGVIGVVGAVPGMQIYAAAAAALLALFGPKRPRAHMTVAGKAFYTGCKNAGVSVLKAVGTKHTEDPPPTT